ncbi:hypothetical protein QGM71_02525 [Virgibacillus sp. C22-A2]|uniref:Uncharacterized protein n=1 Tax=Virgibacillus tibetensis TaxID=3042313 RepID=A0ABU6KB63_9BACI|nr:hypothetical protein [Virgibacillus sp. C22-A2]
MSITKGSLRNFIEGRFREASEKVNTEIGEYYESEIEPLLDDKLQNLDKAIKQVSKISDEFLKFQEDNGLSDYFYSRYLRDFNNFTSIKGSTKNKELTSIKFCVRNDKTYTLFGLEEEIEKAKKDLRPKFNKLKDLNKLQSEINAVITNATTGKKAYNDLKILGVDMEDYKEVNANLPAIKKFSVDTCLVNGNCE